MDVTHVKIEIDLMELGQSGKVNRSKQNDKYKKKKIDLEIFPSKSKNN